MVAEISEWYPPSRPLLEALPGNLDLLEVNGDVVDSPEWTHFPLKF